MSYNVKLDVFEGPLDLLLFFIQRDEINIYDIPISYITKEFLEYINIMQSLKLHLAGEFLAMAAMLMRIKVKMLLPKSLKNDDEDIEDPRTELVDMLLEYNKYKEGAKHLRALEEKQKKFNNVNFIVNNDDVDPDIFLSNISLMDIGMLFKKMLDHIPKDKIYEVKKIKININKQIQFINSFFINRKKIKFKEIIKNIESRIEIIVTFLAILELIKIKTYSVSQNSIYGDMWLTQLNNQE